MGAIIDLFMLLVPAILLSGLASPVAGTPGWIRKPTVVHSIHYLIAIMGDLFLRGSGWELARPQR